VSRPEGIDRDELVARLADLYVTENEARSSLLGCARTDDCPARAGWLLEAAGLLRAACRAREEFREALRPDHDTAIGGEAIRLAEEIARDRLDRKYRWGKYAKPAEAQP